MSGGGTGSLITPGRPQRQPAYRRANTSINLSGAVADSDLFRSCSNILDKVHSFPPAYSHRTFWSGYSVR